jgi:hypothetical protein
MALLTRGTIPSDENFDVAYERAVGSLDMPFTVSSGMLEGLDDLAFSDALEATGIDREIALASDDEVELSNDDLLAVLGALNAMYLDGDEGAGSTCERILSQLGFIWV